ncbi:ferritin subunit [Diorhabda carinulata]|uniref:ferritin subunit n=1 Tax=Diorhabda sublineata TaxID=1163346 RepID=UPI0024E05A4D|nr:ferritin subunit [Diorhabda sublineata]XP_057652943.1 ferritin subunit [Diorhabda carinulata]
MKYATIIVFFACIAGLSAIQLKCAHQDLDIPKEWIDMNNVCVNRMRQQIEDELKASMQYLAMGAHFSRDTVNRPGFADLFFKAASEEREHAIKLISYLLMRGELTSSVSDLIKRNLSPPITSWDSGVSALKDALKLEATVTKKIRDVIRVCEDATNYNDYHLVDYLTGDFLEEQYHGQRDIAGKVSNLEKLMASHGKLGEWLFDKKLQGLDIV